MTRETSSIRETNFLLSTPHCERLTLYSRLSRIYFCLFYIILVVASFNARIFFSFAYIPHTEFVNYLAGHEGEREMSTATDNLINTRRGKVPSILQRVPKNNLQVSCFFLFFFLPQKQIAYRRMLTLRPIAALGVRTGCESFRTRRYSIQTLLVIFKHFH